ncbi:MAG: hypothetical protein BMS9Abin06_0510 [Gammaproteobacteria bacterium]|nr:MAG: hypothetical protein BMS9Abin06_0510 [Gammaproteobacteria bacterium]
MEHGNTSITKECVFTKGKLNLVENLIFVLLFLCAQYIYAAVPLKISVKFILDASGNRPITGNLNTDNEIETEISEGVSILASTFTEFEIITIEYEDLPGVSQWYSTSVASPDGGTNRDNLRAAAIADPGTYLWRTDAINIYINGGTSSALSKFPPDNDIILMNQWCSNTPSCVLHELGHSVNLMHTHETCCTNGDECADTLADDPGYDKDALSFVNFGAIYSGLTSSQKNQVDLTFNNIMSYHTSEEQRRLTNCQMDRVSIQADSDRSWLLSKNPIYINKNYSGIFQFGRYLFPHKNIQSALDAGSLNNGVLVLQQGTHTMIQDTINANVELLSRSGPSTLNRGVQLYKLPVDLHKSQNPMVKSAVVAAQREDRIARKIMHNARKSARLTTDIENRDRLFAKAKTDQKKYQDNAIKLLLKAEKHATGDEKIAIQLELAQRYRYANNLAQSVNYYDRVANATDQNALKKEAGYLADKFRRKLREQ